MALLELRDVEVGVGGRRLLHDVDLTVDEGECHVLVGPNGAGKTALIGAVAGLAPYEVTDGALRFDGEDLVPRSTDERARLGIGSFLQRPPVVHGVTLRELVAMARPRTLEPESLDAIADELGCRELLDRDVNDGFSGGESKLAELIQLVARSPLLCLVDEPDAGVDADNLATIGRTLSRLLDEPVDGRHRAIVVITHSGDVLDLLPVTEAHLLTDGTVVHRHDPGALLTEIRAHGYRQLAP